MRIVVLLGALAFCTEVVSVSESCPSFFEGPNCSDIQCVNGGYRDVVKNLCVCPPGYLGIHCEAVKTSLPPDGHFKSDSSFNILNINLHTQYWGFRTYQNIQKSVSQHVVNYTYDSYNLLESNSTPYLDNFDEAHEDVTFADIVSSKPLTLSPSLDAGLYWCYRVPIYTQLVNLMKQASLKNTAITVISQHPPSSQDFSEARQMALSFGVRINVLWLNDQTFSRCKSAELVEFQSLAQVTGGLFVQLQAEQDDATVGNLISLVLRTHYKPQYIAVQSFADCSVTRTVPVTVDPVGDSPYTFVILGDTGVPTPDAYRTCHLQQLSRSFDNQLTVFSSNSPECPQFDFSTASGSCTVLIFTNGSPQLSLAVYTSYVEDVTIDSSRYAIVESVPFYPAFHVESDSSVTVNSISASDDRTWSPSVVNRGQAAYDWFANNTIKCDDATQIHSLSLNVTVGSNTVQRAVRVACVPVPTVTTIQPTTLTSSSDSGASDPTSAILTSTAADASTSSSPEVCNIGSSYSTFLFAYATDSDVNTYALVSRTIIQAISSNQYNYSALANVRIDTAVLESISYSDNTLQFDASCNTLAPNASLASGARSNIVDVIKTFLTADDKTRSLENSMIVALVDNQPKLSDDFTDAEYDKLTNMNVKIFPIMSIKSLQALASVEFYNRLAAQTNGHFVVANDSVVGFNQDVNEIASSLMSSAYQKNLLFTRNLASDRLGTNIGTVSIPKSDSANVTVTITVTLSASGQSTPQPPSRLLLAFRPNGSNTGTLAIDFLNSADVTRYDGSNFYTTTVQLEAGFDRNVFFISGSDSDVLIRMWIDRPIYHHATFSGFTQSHDLVELDQVDEYTGAGLRMQLFNDCYNDKPGTILITDCNGDVSARYDVQQTATPFPDKGSFPHYYFVPFFCDSAPKSTCVSGAGSKYDVQFVSDQFSVSRSFQCRVGSGNVSPNCVLTDANSNHQCSGVVPFKRGPTGDLNDCSNHGVLQYDQDTAGYNCLCDSDKGYDGDSCESVSCALPNTDPVAIDNTYRTYTVVLGVDSDTASLIIEDAQIVLGLKSTKNLNNIWKYQLIVYCADGAVDMLYSGGDIELFKKAFSSNAQCNAIGKPGDIDMTKVYELAVQGVGRNVKGVIVYFSENYQLLDVTLDDFLVASQVYRQQFFVMSADEKLVQNRMNESIAHAAMSTGGFLMQSNTGSDKPELDPDFIPDLLASSSSIAWFSPNQTSDFSYSTKDESIKTYLLAWGAGDTLKNANTAQLTNSSFYDDKFLSCLLNSQTSYTIKRVDLGAYYVAVYVLDDVAPIAQIISDLGTDVADAVSTTSSDARSIVSIRVPEGYSIVANDNDGGVTRSAKRTGCEFNWTTYSVFSSQKFSAGANAAMVTLQDDSTSTKYTRFFAFGTTSAPVCRNGGTSVTATGSCVCPDGFQGADCSLVNCLENSASNAWADVCVCTDIADVSCATRNFFY